MSRNLFSPKPWFELFTTDFGLLRKHRTIQLEELKTEQETESSDEEQDSDCGSETTNPDVLDVLALPAEVISNICSLLEAEQLSMLAQVCNKFLAHVYNPLHWRRIAIQTWPNESIESLERQLYAYKTWRLLCIHRPRLRTNAIYVTRHQFAKSAGRFAATEPTAPVFLVTYHRFLRFYSDGTVVSLTTPEAPHVSFKRVHRSWVPTMAERDKSHPNIGTYHLDEESMHVSIELPMIQPKFPNMRGGTMFMRFQLHHTRPGAWDRLVLTDHYAIMDHEGGDLIPYSPDSFGGKPFKMVSIWGFKKHIYEEFPRDDDHDLKQWYEMKQAARASKRNRSG